MKRFCHYLPIQSERYVTEAADLGLDRTDRVLEFTDGGLNDFACRFRFFHSSRLRHQHDLTAGDSIANQVG